MIHTRWYLKRPTPPHQTEIQLVVEEIGGERRGYCCSVATRAYAREMLPELRRILVGVLTREREPVRTYDPVETDNAMAVDA